MPDEPKQRSDNSGSAPSWDSSARSSKAASAWYEYMLKGGTPRVMSPMDEFAWFETPVPAMFVTPDLTASWLNVLGVNPRRVAVVFSKPGERQFTSVTVFSGAGPDIFFGQATPDGALGYDIAIQPSFGISMTTIANDTSGTIQVWPGSPPDVDGLPNGIKVPTDGTPLTFLQKDLGPLVQGEWYAQSNGASRLFVCEIVLRDFPKQ